MHITVKSVKRKEKKGIKKKEPIRHPSVEFPEHHDASTSTLYESEEQSIQTTTMVHESCQAELTTVRELKYDEESLLKFLLKVLPKIEKELNKSSKVPNQDDFESDISTETIVTLQKYDYNHKEMVINRLCWNSNGSSVAVSLVYASHVNWCKHSSYLLLYKSNINGKFEPDVHKSITVNTCITDLKYHPLSPHILAISTDEGKIFIYNFQHGGEHQVVQLNCDSNERITQIGWITKSDMILLAMTRSDGILSLWNVSPYDEQEYRSFQKYKFQTDDGKIHEKVSGFDFSPLKDYFIVAVEGGLVLGCSTNRPSALKSDAEYLNPVLYSYETSTLAINCIKFSPVIADTFAVSCSNDSVRIYTYKQKVPIQIVYPVCSILGLEWNCDQTDVLKTWGLDGDIHFYDCTKGALIKSLHISEHSILCASFIQKRFNQEMVLGDSNGDITIWKSSLHVKSD